MGIDGTNASKKNSPAMVIKENNNTGRRPTRSLRAPNRGDEKNSNKNFKLVAVPKYSEARLLSSLVNSRRSVGKAGNTIVKAIEYKQKTINIGIFDLLLGEDFPPSCNGIF